MNKTFLLDDNFLEKLHNQSQREIWVKILALTINEEPVEEITGRVTGGSISVDGASKLRRSCSLNLVSDRMSVNEYIWGLNTKVKISIGLKNKVDPLKYGDIVWFPQGIFVLNSFNISINNQQSTISLQGKDKMCLVNGDLGGNLTALTYLFDTVEEENGYNSYYKRKLPLRRIIREAVHTFAKEPYHNIIINDLDDWGLELLTYRGEEPMYLSYSPEEDDIINMTLNSNQVYWVEDSDGKRIDKTLQQLSDDVDFVFKDLTHFISQDINPTKVYGDKESKKAFEIIKIEQGMTCGYRMTDLIYPKDLTINVGEGLTSMLDKLISMLGNFEYFYNLDGQFIFQKKRTFVDTSWNNFANNEEELWAEHTAYTSSHVYSLYDSKLVSSFSNNPALNNVKNDFSIWGTKKSVNGNELPVHMRYAIDTKPEYYKNIAGQIFVTDKSVYDRMKEEVKTTITNDLAKRIQSFQLSHPPASELLAPIKQIDGSWSAGWWDIRDWHDFYVLLTGEEPRYTMKWYSKNSLEGCVRAKDLPITYSQKLDDNEYVWLLIKNNSTGIFNAQHGRGNPQASQQVEELWESWKNADGSITTQAVRDENGNVITELFMQPYATCSYNHTYLVFLENDVKSDRNTVYFYNPNFPAYDSFDELVKDQVDKEYNEYIESGKLNLVDWREIIYQMAKDHNKYGNLDNTNPKVQLVKVYSTKTGEDIIMTRQEYNERKEDTYTNIREISLVNAVRELNSTVYPTGYTGYEQYYIDVLGFWRELYNPEYTCSYSLESINRLEFEAVQTENLLFYDAPVYTLCTDSTLFYDDIDYYIKENDQYILTPVTEAEFKLNYANYYYISDVEVKPVPIKVTEPVLENKYYKISDHTEVTYTGQEDFDPKEYSIKHTDTKKIRIFKQETYHPAYLFTKYNPVTQSFQSVSEGITAGDYATNPWIYYRNKSGKQTCCTSVSIPVPLGRADGCWFENSDNTQKIETYTMKADCGYVLDWTHGTVAINKDITNEMLTEICVNATRCDDTLEYQKTAMPWYYCYNVDTYEPLVKPAIEYDPQGTYYTKSDIVEYNPKDSENEYWRYDYNTNPESLTFWFDFLDTDGELQNYNVQRIGDRPKAVNDSDVKAIYFRETPGVIFLEPDDWEAYTTQNSVLDKPTGYAFAQMPFYLKHLFAISSQGKSAKDVLDEYLYKYSYCTESVTVSALPIYHLEPNTRILIRDDNSHINGEYIVNKMTIPLDAKGSMSINAVKAVDRLY